ncbi:basic 7S globulin-like [Quillaja saponaria]|uniref:Basic 7S globulin-like n=1 Tax=Quillaja saponaria TaxID=32244 RepID=A0AAD7LBA3_QUISA|nr:basic 7S globulin-like [Quillaja saponaria]
MASTFYILLLFCCNIVFLISPSIAKTSFRPKALVLPVTKDAATNQYVTQLHQRTPSVPVKLTVDLGGHFLWVDCNDNYVSSTYKPARCRTTPCSLADTSVCGVCNGDQSPGCNNNTCIQNPFNSIFGSSTTAEVAQDVISIQSLTVDGSKPGKVVSKPNFVFSCSGLASLTAGLASGVKGIAGLGRTKIGLPSQFSSAFSFPNKFAICLSPSTTSNGVIFLGDSPYVLLPAIDISKKLMYTPLIKNPITQAPTFFGHESSGEYFIRVRSIKINGKAVPLNTSLLSIDREGNGGTKISTVNPYTVLETTIYNAFLSTFDKQVRSATKVAPVAPFGLCYDSKSFGNTRVGLGVPSIDLVLQNKKVVWKIFGANSMVQVSNKVVCLGFVDGGQEVNRVPRAFIIIGGHQLEDNLLQFDLPKSRLGFSSSLLFSQTTCANFNF